MRPGNEPVLYSTNTWISYAIAQKYYRQTHYVWCTPHFDPKRIGLESAVPPTSSPFDMYRQLHEHVVRGDRHSSKVKENKVGLLRGANAKLDAGVITAAEHDQIARIVEAAGMGDFRPLLFVIPASGVASLLVDPPVEDKAHPLSAEYILPELPRSSFDVIEFGGWL